MIILRVSELILILKGRIYSTVKVMKDERKAKKEKIDIR